MGPRAKAPKAPRATKSIKIYADIHHRADVFASREQRKLQDVISEAVDQFLKKNHA